MDRRHDRVNRRRVLQSVGVAGGLYGIPSGLGHRPESAAAVSDSGISTDWDVATVDLTDFLGGIAGTLFSKIKQRVEDWLRSAFDNLSDLYDTATELIADSVDDIQVLSDIDFLLNEGEDLLEEIYDAEEEWEEQQEEEEENGSDGGNSTTTNSSTSAASAAGSASSGAAGAGAGSTAAAAGFFSDVPDPSDIASAYDDLADEAVEIVEETYDDVEAFLERIGDGLTYIFDKVSQAFADRVLEPIYDLASPIVDMFESPGEDLSFDFDFPGLDIDLPFSFSAPYGTLDPTGGQSASATSAATAAGSTGTRATGTGATGHRSGPSLNDRLEEAYNEVTGEVSSQTPLTFDEQQCKFARGPVQSVGFQVEVPNFGFEIPGPPNLDSTKFGLFVGLEPGRPCTYVGTDTEATVSVGIDDVIDSVQQNQAEAYAVGNYLYDIADHYATELEPVIADAQDSAEVFVGKTLEDLHRTAESLGDAFSDAEEEIESEHDIELNVSEVMDDLEVESLESEAQELVERVEEASRQLLESTMVQNLVAVAENAAAGGVPHPPSIDTIAEASGDLTEAGLDELPSVDVNFPELLKRESGDVAAWIQDLDDRERAAIESETGVDLDLLQTMLTDVSRDEFALSEYIASKVEELVQARLNAMKKKLEEYTTWEHDFTKGWDEWLCHGLCWSPMGPVPVATWWIAEELWDAVMRIRNASPSYDGTLHLPGGVTHDFEILLFDAILLALLILVVIALIVFFAPALGISLTGIFAFISGGATYAIALMPIIILILAYTGNLDGVVQVFSDLFNGEQTVTNQTPQ